MHRELAKASSQYFDLAHTSGGPPAKSLVFNEPVLINLGKQTYLIEPPSRPRKCCHPSRQSLQYRERRHLCGCRPTR